MSDPTNAGRPTRREALGFLTLGGALAFGAEPGPPGLSGPQVEARLVALAGIVLPAALGREGCLHIVDGFLRWLAGYPVGVQRVELDALSGIVGETEPLRLGRYRRQLRQLEGCTTEEVSAILEAHLDGAVWKEKASRSELGSRRDVRERTLIIDFSSEHAYSDQYWGEPGALLPLPGPAELASAGMDHVALSLMAFYFHSSDAHDALMRAPVGRRTCRPLDLA